MARTAGIIWGSPCPGPRGCPRGFERGIDTAFHRTPAAGCKRRRSGGYRRQEARVIEKQHRINEQIRITPIRVIGADGGQLGIIPTEEAMGIAREAGLDLVEVAPNEKPPVCRIMDFGKFKYQQKKKHHKTHVHHAKIKEIRLRPKTGEHDIEFKVNQARGFLEHRDKVIVSVVFRGREMAHIEEGQRVMKNILAQLEPVSKVEGAPQQMGRRLICTLAPK